MITFIVSEFKRYALRSEISSQSMQADDTAAEGS